MAWKILFEKHAYRRVAEDNPEPGEHFSFTPSPEPFGLPSSSLSSRRQHDPIFQNPCRSAPDLAATSPIVDGPSSTPHWRRRGKATSYRSHFKQKYMVETAWRKGGQVTLKHITPEQGVVTSLHLTPKYIVVALDNAKIHVFNMNGEHQKMLQGHVMGVWAMVPWDDILVSGGCDRDVRVWNMATG
jgi:F-box and WD-40 domain protein CDC4